jgi:hypothetical protein
VDDAADPAAVAELLHRPQNTALPPVTPSTVPET